MGKRGFQKGQYHHTAEIKKKISEHNASKRPEIREKISKKRKEYCKSFHKRKPLSEKTKKKISEALKKKKGGITPENIIIRNSKRYKRWRIKILIRDNFTCQGCQQVGGKLEVHHIKSFSKYFKLRFDVNNGIVLCHNCHKLTDNYQGRTK